VCTGAREIAGEKQENWREQSDEARRQKERAPGDKEKSLLTLRLLYAEHQERCSRPARRCAPPRMPPVCLATGSPPWEHRERSMRRLLLFYNFIALFSFALLRCDSVISP
jgi:hypothetical protein